MSLMNNAGFLELCIFSNRKPIDVSLSASQREKGEEYTLVNCLVKRSASPSGVITCVNYK